MNWELPDVQAGIRKGNGTRDQIANIRWIIEKTKEFQKNIYFCFINYAKAFDYVDQNKLYKILKEMGIPDHLTCLLGNLYAGQESTVRTRHRTMDRFKIRKEVQQGCILSPCLFNLYAEYITCMYIISHVHHEKCLAGWVTSWNQHRQEKYQQSQISRWYHSNGRRQRGTKEPLDEGERGEQKSWLET